MADSKPIHRYRITRTFRQGLMAPELPEGGQPPRHVWYLQESDRQIGPWAPWDLYAAWRQGELRSDTPVRREDMGQCVPLRDAWDLVDNADREQIRRLEQQEAAEQGSGPHLRPLTD